jgi:hypothetical protein
MTSRERAEKAYRDVREFPLVASRGVAIIELAIDAAVGEAVAAEREACAMLAAKEARNCIKMMEVAKDVHGWTCRAVGAELIESEIRYRGAS